MTREEKIICCLPFLIKIIICFAIVCIAFELSRKIASCIRDDNSHTFSMRRDVKQALSYRTGVSLIGLLMLGSIVFSVIIGTM